MGLENALQRDDTAERNGEEDQEDAGSGVLACGRRREGGAVEWCGGGGEEGHLHH